MAVDKVFYPYSLELPANTSPSIAAASVSVLSDPQSSWDVVEVSERGAGVVGPEFVGSLGEKPMFSASTTQIKPILERLLGYHAIGCMTASGQNVTIQYRKGSSCTARVPLATAEHVLFRFVQSGVMHLEEISARQNELASVRFAIGGVYDGTNAPAACLDGQALSAAAAASGFFTLGPSSIDGTLVQGLESMSLQLGAQIDELSGDGSTYLDYRGLANMTPVLRLVYRNAELMKTYGGAGVNVPSGGVAVYLRSAEPSSAGLHLVPKATTSHIKISAAKGKIRARQLSQAPNRVELEVRISRDAANDLWHKIEYGQAIGI